ncbi:flagellin N-terminal helical domain-containing protein [Pseudorhodoferax sp.]|uniref:flagellin N-terminal helical domain-containing protein n=1 Tax=Pseudorhodoferax sp. TaxID=1993553 RepID=UPI002DD64EDE|nr:flagellin [Pseudorhodoferax sp.]
MASTINTNTISLNAQRNLSSSQSSLSVSMQRLSSGLRVNSAKDDAAGLAISERMNSQIKGNTVAARNSNDGISLAQTAEGALGKVGDMLQRMRELAVQSSNATNSTNDRKALQAEVSQLIDEIDRVAKQTSFNGTKILDGSFSGAVFQVGANSGDNITVGALTDSRATGLADVVYAYDQTTGIAASNITDTSAITNTAALQINDGTTTWDLGAIAEASSGSERLGQMVEAINRKSADTGVTAFLTRGSDGLYTIDLMSSKTTTAGDATTVTLTGFTANNFGYVAAAVGAAGTALSATSTTTDSLGIDTLSIDTQANAWVALKKIDSAIDQVNNARADLGALQSRFENSVGSIEIQVENLSASRGRIVDADFASETANLSRTQILQQAGTAMVAQANQLPQGVLALLQ